MTPATSRLLMIEINEVNFDFVRAYVGRGVLPTFARLIAQHGLRETASEQSYVELEPWIQWVTAHTGKTLADHGVFRLGDIVNRPDLRQVWEQLEAAGVSVGAISPMNARNACVAPAFFLPDPWTPTSAAGGALLRRLHAAVAQMVNDNASGRVRPESLAALGAGVLRWAAPGNYGRYLSHALRIREPWQRALVLDLLLSDVFIAQVRRTRPAFASMFLNAAAHIQHHYLFNAAVYDGPNANPAWYVAAERDPVLEVYALYDRILARLLAAFPDARLMIATGLHQDPHPVNQFYWRLRDHADFLTRCDVPFVRVEPRMSRDFLVFCADAAQARAAAAILGAMTADNGTPLFEVDLRGHDLFVMLTYGEDLPPELGWRSGGRRHEGLRKQCAFVAIKNGGHNGVGYLIDTADGPGPHAPIPLAELHTRTLAHFGVSGATVDGVRGEAPDARHAAA